MRAGGDRRGGAGRDGAVGDRWAEDESSLPLGDLVERQADDGDLCPRHPPRTSSKATRLSPRPGHGRPCSPIAAPPARGRAPDRSRRCRRRRALLDRVVVRCSSAPSCRGEEEGEQDGEDEERREGESSGHGSALITLRAALLVARSRGIASLVRWSGRRRGRHGHPAALTATTPPALARGLR